jgi:hypothetical protein
MVLKKRRDDLGWCSPRTNQRPELLDLRHHWIFIDGQTYTGKGALLNSLKYKKKVPVLSRIEAWPFALRRSPLPRVCEYRTLLYAYAM